MQYHDDVAHQMVEEFAGSQPRRRRQAAPVPDGQRRRLGPLRGGLPGREPQLPTSTAHYGPDIPTEAELRLLGDLKGKRVLELGCGGAQCSIAFAKQGATAIGVDFSAEQLAFARRLCEREEVKIELRQGDLADLAFLRADSIDLVFSGYAFGYVDDLNRVFRQVHRVLKVGAPAGVQPPPPGLRHDRRRRRGPGPARSAARTSTGRRSTTRSTGSASPTTTTPCREIYMGLSRASYRVDLSSSRRRARTGTGPSTGERRFVMVPRTLDHPGPQGGQLAG